MAGLYIHIPFCLSRCSYCSFYSTIDTKLKKQYVDALCKELALRKDYLFLPQAGDNNEVRDTSLTTIYFGGGTPSCLTKEEFEQIFSAINLHFKDNLKEITIECNPDDITPDYVKTLKHYANRVSLGIQSFNDNQLNIINRRHSANEAINAVKLLQREGVSNISVDLIFGFPNETLEDWKNDINQALSLNVQHISAYSLMYEEGTKLYYLLEKGKIKPISEELSLRMFDTLVDELVANGYEHYEISNFAKQGFRSVHNSNYWRAIPYLGVGASAHSYDKTSRQWNIANIQQYIEAINRGEVPCEKEILDKDTQYNDLITTALRTKEGICINDLSPLYADYLMKNSDAFLKNGTMEKTADNYIRLTRKGLYISDNIMAELVKV